MICKAVAISYVCEEGEKNIGVVLDYGKNLIDCGLKTKDFNVRNRTITKVYINNEIGITTASVKKGNYVVLELSPQDESSGTLVSDNGKRYRKIPEYSISQKISLLYDDGELCRPWEGNVETVDMINKEFDQFMPGTYKDEETGVHLEYQLFAPSNYDRDKRYPLLLFFHGGGEKGSDNIMPLLCSQGGIIWADKKVQERNSCFILVPQCPSDSDWVDPDVYEIKPSFTAVCHLLFSILDQYPIDKSRLYCTGLSMGSMASWKINLKYPGLFAASIFACGQFNYEGTEILKDKHIWAFNPEDDDKSMSGIADIMETIENAGGKVNRDVWNGALRGERAEKSAKEQIARGGNILHTQFLEGSLQAFWVHVVGWFPIYSNPVIREWLFNQRNEEFSKEEKEYKINAQLLPVRIALGFSGKKIKQIAMGNRHNVALLQDGRVYTWGFNCTGELGNGKEGAFSEERIPQLVQGLQEIVQVAAGNNFSLALTKDGNVFAWGCNTCGQLGNSNFATRFVKPIKIEGIHNIKEIDAGDNYGIALRKDGTVWAWGSNVNGQLGNGTLRRDYHPVQVKDPLDETGYLQHIVHIQAGIRTVLAITEEGKLRSWGDGEYGQLGNEEAKHGPGTQLPVISMNIEGKWEKATNIQTAVSGRCFTVILKQDGNVYSWGLNRHGELGAGYFGAKDIDPKTVKNPDFLNVVLYPVKAAGLENVLKIAAGMNHTIALKNDGTVWSWGYNREMSTGVLGICEWERSNHPMKIKNLENIRNIYAGLNHNIAVQKDGTVWAWGNGNQSRLGDN